MPLIRYNDAETGLEVDFLVNNPLGIINSDLIFKYSQVDQRFHIMNVYLKHWAKHFKIIGASNQFLSSYALTLMIIAYLQSTKPFVLPCL